MRKGRLLLGKKKMLSHERADAGYTAALERRNKLLTFVGLFYKYVWYVIVEVTEFLANEKINRKGQVELLMIGVMLCKKNVFVVVLLEGFLREGMVR